MADTTEIMAPVENGKLVNDYSKKTDTSSKASGSELGYDQFLTLLCAEMQYQDPLEPTSNTEYVAQLATFSQLEASLSMKDSFTAMQESVEKNLSSTLLTVETNMATSLVGKDVILCTEDGTYVDGKVDYIMYDEDGSVLLSVNDSLYPLSTLDTVADADYYDAVAVTRTFESMLSQLPELEELDATYEKAIAQIRELYDGMTSYQQGFVNESSLSKLESYEQKLAELIQAAEETGESNGTDGEESQTENQTETNAV